MKRVLVTGGAGFIGSHLVHALADRGYEVNVLDNLKRGRVRRIDRDIRSGAAYFIEGDIRDVEVLREAATGCNAIYHLAAQSNVMGALDDPEYSFTTNTQGTFNVLRCAVDLEIPRVVFTSSREVYGEPDYAPVDEDHPLKAKNPYGASKLAGEAYCRVFQNCYGLDVAVTRLANVYGPDDTSRVIPLWLEQASTGRDLTVYGGNQILDFIWIDTVVEALIHAGAHGLSGPTNIGSGVGTTILELGQRIIATLNANVDLVRLASRNAEVRRFVADITRMKALGIEPPSDPLAHLPQLADMYGVGVAVS
jgi:UDP-glucose 4-epimerase